jgi:hypothetical protein
VHGTDCMHLRRDRGLWGSGGLCPMLISYYSSFKAKASIPEPAHTTLRPPHLSSILRFYLSIYLLQLFPSVTTFAGY